MSLRETKQSRTLQSGSVKYAIASPLISGSQ